MDRAPRRPRILHPLTIDKWQGKAREFGYPSLTLLLVELHYKYQFSLRGIAVILASSRWTVQNLMRTLGIPSRRRQGIPLSPEERLLLARARAGDLAALRERPTALRERPTTRS